MGILSWLLPKPLYYDLYRKTSWLDWGPHTDPNKVAPIMAQYAPSKDWPRWCRLTSHAPHVIRSSILSDLPADDERKRGTTLKEEVENIRLQSLTHYKCYTDWNHEFIRADFIQVSTGKPLVALWERDLPLAVPGKEQKRKSKIKSGLPCKSVDRVTYITETDFLDFVKIKDAYKLRTATFPSLGPTILDVYAVLETHSVMFPVYYVYSTMCYWYADSTFEVLIDLYRKKVANHDPNITGKGIWTLGNFKAIAYSGITRESISTTVLNTSSEAMSYEQQLVTIQGELNRKFNTEDPTEDDYAHLPEDEQESVKVNGWNAVPFLNLLKKMPSHDELLAASKARVAEVLEELDAIQNGREEADAATRRELEAKLCRDVETALAKKEAKWKKINDDLQKKNEEQRKKDAKQIEELQKKSEELQKKSEEQQKKSEEQRKKDAKQIEELQKKNEEQ